MPYKILAIDDNEDLVILIQNLLQVHRYEVATALNGEDGLRKAKSEKFDLIILDLIMPDINGDVVARKLKEHYGTLTVPLIFLTSMVDKGEDTIKINVDERFYPAISKPFNSEKLLKCIEESFK